jgi:hypothetical protein
MVFWLESKCRLVPPLSKRNILGGNAARLFNLDPTPVKNIPPVGSFK